MKDILITKKQQKHELLTWLACFCIAMALNIYAIIAYDGFPWELITSAGYLIVFATLLYAVWTLLRLAAWGIRKVLHKKNNQNTNKK